MTSLEADAIIKNQATLINKFYQRSHRATVGICNAGNEPEIIAL